MHLKNSLLCTVGKNDLVSELLAKTNIFNFFQINFIHRNILSRILATHLFIFKKLVCFREIHELSVNLYIFEKFMDFHQIHIFSRNSWILENLMCFLETRVFLRNRCILEKSMYSQ